MTSTANMAQSYVKDIPEGHRHIGFSYSQLEHSYDSKEASIFEAFQKDQENYFESGFSSQGNLHLGIPNVGIIYQGFPASDQSIGDLNLGLSDSSISYFKNPMGSYKSSKKQKLFSDLNEAGLWQNSNEFFPEIKQSSLLSDNVRKLLKFRTFVRYFEKLNEVKELLGFEHNEPYDLTLAILTIYANKGIDDIKISRTGENEFLLYRDQDGNFKNLMIDEDGYVVYMYIPVERENTVSEFYSKDSLDIQKLASKLL